MNQPCARSVAIELLAGGGIPTRRFVEKADEAGLSGPERGLARLLVAETLRRQVTLDVIWSAFSRRRVGDKALEATLRLGVLQLLFLDNIPDHAAVSATIDAASPWLGAGKSVANAVLRAIQRGAKRETPPSRQPHRKRLLLPQTSFFFDRLVFTSPHKNTARYWGQQYGYTFSLAQRWWKELGSEAMRDRMLALNKPSALCLRVNTLRITRDGLLELFEKEGVVAVPSSHPASVVLPKTRGAVEALPGFAEGYWAVQDLTSIESISLAFPKEGERILDLCAAPGGKSFAAYELSGGKAEVHSCDVDGDRLDKMVSECERLGHELPRHVIQENGEGVPDGEWDLLVVDAPCTNTGVLHKRPEARLRFNNKELHRATTVQNLIRKGMISSNLSPHTRVLWCTCSLEPEENQQMAARLAKQLGLRLAKERLFEPSSNEKNPRSGGYAALLVPADSDSWHN